MGLKIAAAATIGLIFVGCNTDVDENPRFASNQDLASVQNSLTIK